MQLLREGNGYPPVVDRFFVFFKYVRVGRI